MVAPNHRSILPREGGRVHFFLRQHFKRNLGLTVHTTWTLGHPGETKEQMKQTMEFIKTVPIGFLKGRTFNASLLIVDEAEDLSVQEILLCMTRLGKFSKMLIIGDFDQVNVKSSGFQRVYDAFDSAESQERGIYCLPFTHEDIMRNKVLQYVSEKFKHI